MRAVVCCALCALGSAARADFIQITGVVANYDTQRDVVDIEVWLDRPFDPALGEYVRFSGHHNWYPDFSSTRFELCNCHGRDVFDSFRFALETFDMPPDRSGKLNEQITMDIPVTMTERMRDGEMRTVVSTSLATDAIRFADFTPADSGRDEFAFSATVQSKFNGRFSTDVVGGTSTINAPRLITSPEPASVAIAAIGVVLLCVHLRRRPRSRLAL